MQQQLHLISGNCSISLTKGSKKIFVSSTDNWNEHVLDVGEHVLGVKVCRDSLLETCVSYGKLL